MRGAKSILFWVFKRFAIHAKGSKCIACIGIVVPRLWLWHDWLWLLSKMVSCLLFCNAVSCENAVSCKTDACESRRESQFDQTNSYYQCSFLCNSDWSHPTVFDSFLKCHSFVPFHLHCFYFAGPIFGIVCLHRGKRLQLHPTHDPAFVWKFWLHVQF